MFGLKLRGFPELDSLRFVAATMVVLHHLYFSSNAFFSFFDDYGNVGVDIFFVLSGFIITYGIINSKENFSLWRFMVRRALRLWPTLYVTLFICTLIMFHFARSEAVLAEGLKSKLWHYYFHFANYSYAYWGKLHHVVGLFWSLAIEEHFYVLWGIILSISGLKRKWLLLSISAMICIPYILRWHAHAEGFDPYIIAFATHNRLDSLAIGCLLALIYPSVALSGRVADAVAIPVMILLFMIGFTIMGNSDFHPAIKALDYVFISLGSALLIISALNKKGFLNPILSSKFLASLGILSYGVYLFHIVTHTILFAIVAKHYPQSSHWVLAIIALVAPYVPAYLFYRIVDGKFLALREHAIKKIEKFT